MATFEDQFVGEPSAAMFTWLTATAMKVAVFLLIIYVVAWSAELRRSAARVRYRLWSIAVLGVLVTPFIANLVPSWRLQVLPTMPGASAAAIEIAEELDLSDEAVLQAIVERAIATSSVIKLGSSDETPVVYDQIGPAKALVADSEPVFTMPRLVLAIWITGCSVVVISWLVRVMRARRLGRDALELPDKPWRHLVDEIRNQLGIARRVRLLKSDDIGSPATWGFLRPVVLLPSSAETWSDDRRRVVILHELLHIRRSDWFIGVLARFACALHWFNPLVWLAAHRLTHEGELACDEEVLANGTRPSRYATHLLEISQFLRHRTAPRAAILSMTSAPCLKDRLALILSENKLHRLRLMLPVSASVLTLAILMTVVRPVGRIILLDEVWRDRPMEAARALLTDERWPEAVAVLEGFTHDHPRDGSAWRMLATACQGAGDHSGAAMAYGTALQHGAAGKSTILGLAHSYAQMGRYDEAFGTLEQAVTDIQYDDLSGLQRDKNLDVLRRHDRYDALCARVFPPLGSFEAFDRVGDQHGLVSFWRDNPPFAINVVNHYLRTMLSIADSMPTSHDRFASLRRRALSAALSADQAFESDEFSTYATTVSSWKSEQRIKHHQMRALLTPLHPSGRRRFDYAMAIENVYKVIDTARTLGSTVDLAEALITAGHTHRAVVRYNRPRLAAGAKEEIETAYSRYLEAGKIAHELRIPYYEMIACYGLAKTARQLGREDQIARWIDEGLRATANMRDGKQKRGAWSDLVQLRKRLGLSGTGKPSPAA